MENFSACHACESVLPWYANGQLGQDERAALDLHLRDCSTCRASLAAEERFARTIADTGSVELAPQAAMRRFFERLDTAPAPAARRPRARIALLAAAQALLFVAAGAWLGAHSAAPAYVTESAQSAPASGPRIRLVADPKASLAEFERLLGRLGASVVAGPSEARVYTLAFPATLSGEELKARLTLARQDPAVTFAEPLGGTP
jgi:hypothetical protein